MKKKKNFKKYRVIFTIQTVLFVDSASFEEPVDFLINLKFRRRRIMKGVSAIVFVWKLLLTVRPSGQFPFSDPAVHRINRIYPDTVRVSRILIKTYRTRENAIVSILWGSARSDSRRLRTEHDIILSGYFNNTIGQSERVVVLQRTRVFFQNGRQEKKKFENDLRVVFWDRKRRTYLCPLMGRV